MPASDRLAASAAPRRRAVPPMSGARAAAIWGGCALLAAGGFVASLACGSVALTPVEVLRALFGAGSHGTGGSLAVDIVRGLRAPRAAAGFACGALLSLAGALLQVLLRNPLAEPYVLGVSGGAAAGAALALAAAWPALAVDAAALGGALLSIALVLGLARRALRHGGADDALDASPRLLLTGVVVASGWGALLLLLLTLAPDGRLRGILFWLAGDLDGVFRVWPALAALAFVLAAVVPLAPRLNALLRGADTAQALGVDVARLRLRIYLLASLATALAVTTAGTIGFVGLVVPHLLRLTFGNDQRMLLPAAALTGGTLVMLADLAARTVIAPAQLPVGVVTALVGVPAFLWMLLRRPR